MNKKTTAARRYKNYVISAVILILLSAAVVVAVRGLEMKPAVSPTESFIKRHMMNANGTLATYLKHSKSEHEDIVAGREALSESLGLWMQYALLIKNHALFQEGYEQLMNNYVTPQQYIAWKRDSDGAIHANTNALGDDFRIVGSLLKAAKLWEEEHYLKTAKAISETLLSKVRKDGYYTDFYDFAREELPDTLSLVYIDSAALAMMLDAGFIDKSIFDRHADLLRHMPDDGLFYPKVYDIAAREYRYDASVNLIDQLIVAIHRTTLGGNTDVLASFLKTEFSQEHKLMGRYDRASRAQEVSYESPAVYGLAILLAVEQDDRAWAKQLHERMIALRSTDALYSGGYVFDGNTHLFDNLLPLLAETALKVR
ncbi:glycosyl hydrolase [Paenibacillaceae bacterium]|nr:glycosyl hydrolase [Paenibacillaceae bacterium]